ncbi:MAG: hypothetical protein LBQ33_06190 [Oscillospiraceae bacterium]|nr:hypothetical protein [Oscillospiraceae bacterium]
MERVELWFDPNATIHISQILVGFALLAQQGKLTLRCRREAFAHRFGHNQVVLARFADGCAAVFDTHDNGRLHVAPEVFDDSMRALAVRGYFRRSFRREYYAACESAALQHPLGFNYHLSCPGNPYSRIIPAEALRAFRDPAKRHILLRKLLAGLPFGRLSDRQFYPECFAQTAAHPAEERILFHTRTWFPLEEHDPTCSPKNIEGLLARYPNLTYIFEMDETRAKLIRLLRREYGSRAAAGFAHSRFAQAMYPDLILPRTDTRRARYLRTMRRAAVCLTTIGLSQSTGWKFGEYVSAAQAIVSEPLFFEVPGEFRAGENYLAFRAPEEALAQSEALLCDPLRALGMRERNEAYYQRYLRPEALVGNCLDSLIRQKEGVEG